MLKTLARRAARALAPFQCVDSFGTDQRAFTFNAAAEWLPYCAPVAAIVNRYTGRIVAVRGLALQVGA